MKIDGDPRLVRIELPEQTERPARPAGSAGTLGVSTSPGGADQITLSPDVQLVGAAIEAAQNSPVVREQAVARARALLAEGRIGDNPIGLADAIIDGWLSAF